MKRLILTTVLTTMLIPLTALAQQPQPDPNNMSEFLTFLISAFQGGQWFAVGALVLMLIVWAIGKWGKIDSQWLPPVTAALGMIASMTVEFMKPDMVWYEALYNGLLTSGSAALFWSALGKRILPKAEKKPA